MIGFDHSRHHSRQRAGRRQRCHTEAASVTATASITVSTSTFTLDTSSTTFTTAFIFGAACYTIAVAAVAYGLENCTRMECCNDKSWGGEEVGVDERRGDGGRRMERGEYQKDLCQCQELHDMKL